jgi:hypothetical protein
MELSDDRITTLVEDVKLPADSFVITFGDKMLQLLSTATPTGCLRTDASLNSHNFSPFIV